MPTVTIDEAKRAWEGWFMRLSDDMKNVMQRSGSIRLDYEIMRLGFEPEDLTPEIIDAIAVAHGRRL